MIVEIDKVSEAKLRVLCPDESTAYAMKDYFSFEIPGIKFSKKYKAARGKWDGRTSVFDMHSGIIGYGLLPYVEEFCRENDLEIKYNFDKNYSNISLDQTLEFLDGLNMHTKGVPLEHRDYQIEAINYACSVNRALILSPTSSGKSSIIYAIIRHYLKDNKRIILVVPNVSLVLQMFNDFKDYSSENGWDAEKNCSLIYANTDRDYDKPIQIGTWQSFKDFNPKFFHDFDVVIGDEAHTFAAEQVSNVLHNCINAYARFGTTGTLKHGATTKQKQLHSLQVQSHFGAIYKTISTREMIDAGYSVKLDFKSYLLKYPKEDKLTCGKTYDEELEWITSNRKRNNFIARLVKKLDGNILVLFHHVDRHGIPLYQGLKPYLEGKKEVLYVSGVTKVKEREKVKEQLQNGRDVVAVCSYGTFSTGINVPNIRHIVFVGPFKDRIRLFQSIGRGLRLFTGKHTCTVHDLGDDIRMEKGDEPNTTLKHMAERIRNLEEENLDVTIYKILLDK